MKFCACEFRGIQMRKFLLSMIVAILVGCSNFVSTDEMEKDIKAQMQKEFNSNSDFSEYHLKVVDLTVVKQNGNQYRGLSKIKYNGKIYKVSVEILMDGNKYMWEIPPENFSFIQKAAIDKYQKELEQTLVEAQKELEKAQQYNVQETDYSYEVADAQAEAEEATRAAQEAAEYAVAEAVDDYS